MNIKTVYWAKPIPIRTGDWCAFDDDTYDGPGSLIGYGATEEDAIANFWEQYDDSKAQEEADKIDAAREQMVRRELSS